MHANRRRKVGIDVAFSESPGQPSGDSVANLRRQLLTVSLLCSCGRYAPISPLGQHFALRTLGTLLGSAARAKTGRTAHVFTAQGGTRQFLYDRHAPRRDKEAIFVA